MNSEISPRDPVYDVILQTRTDSLIRYLSLAPSIVSNPTAPSQPKKSVISQYAQDYIPSHSAEAAE